MIEAFRRIGEEISKEFEGKSEIERKKAVLDCLSNKVKLSYSIAHEKEKKDKSIKKVIINLDLKNKKIYLICDEDLREAKFVFSPSASNGKKIDFNVNDLKYIINNAVPDLIKYIEEDFDKKEEVSSFKGYW